jgi:hypothetical protein
VKVLHLEPLVEVLQGDIPSTLHSKSLPLQLRLNPGDAGDDAPLSAGRPGVWRGMPSPVGMPRAWRDALTEARAKGRACS